MNNLTPQEFSQIVSLYLDDRLGPDEQRRFEHYLTEHPTAAREVDVLRTAQRSLASSAKVAPNDWFWLTLSQRLDAGRNRRSPYTVRRPAFVLSAVTIVLVALIGGIYVKDAPMFHRFFQEKKDQVETVAGSLMSGNILPLFTNVNKEEVLNFALFGSIPIDSSHTTSLQVKVAGDQGAQIRIVKTKGTVPPVSVDEFAEALGISAGQREVVDSILGSYKEKLQNSVLVSDHDAMAIHAELAEMNRSMVTTIAASLEPLQRTRFRRFLDERKAPYSVVAVNTPTVPSHILFRSLPKVSAGKKYVVISPDQVQFAEMTVDLDSLRSHARQQERRIREVMTERMLAELTETERNFVHPHSAFPDDGVRVQSTGGALQIHFESAPSSPFADFGMSELVRPRIPASAFRPEEGAVLSVNGDSLFSFAMPADVPSLRGLKNVIRGEYRFRVVDSVINGQRVKVFITAPDSKNKLGSILNDRAAHPEPLIDLDSLLKESKKEPSVAPQKQTNGKQLEL